MVNLWLRRSILPVWILAIACTSQPAVAHYERIEGAGSDRGPEECESPNRNVGMSTLLLLENRSVEVAEGAARWRITVGDIVVRVEKLLGLDANQTTSIFEVRRMIDERSTLDVDIKLGILEGELVLHWRETFKHRSYRFGLFRFSNGKFLSLCTGTGGVDVSH
jgi:hypothetical protein